MSQTTKVFASISLILLCVGAAEETEPPASPKSPWDLPPANACEPEGGLRGWPLGEDAPPFGFAPGDTLSVELIDVIRDFIPPALFEHREKFFFEGMRLVIGPCFADYSPPAFYREATERFAGQARLQDDGGLEGYTAGLPFAPETIDGDDPKAGLKWGWNFENRYQAAGFHGDFRTSDMVGRNWRAEPFVGEIFKFQLAFRSDRAGEDFVAPGSRQKHWVSGGLMKEPFELAPRVVASPGTSCRRPPTIAP